MVDIRLRYIEPDPFDPVHTIEAILDDPPGIAHMVWNAKGIITIEVPVEHQRQGVATALWREGHRLAAEHTKIPKPKHSTVRTDEGDEWAKAVGGRLPRLQKAEIVPVAHLIIRLD